MKRKKKGMKQKVELGFLRSSFKSNLLSAECPNKTKTEKFGVE